MAGNGGWLTGLQAYSYDVVDGGAESVVKAAELCAADVLFLAVSYLDHIVSSKGGRGPTLRHNPSRRLHGESAFVRPVASRYPTELVPPISDDPGADGEVAHAALAAAAAPRGIKVVPWILALAQPVALKAPGYGVVNVQGDVVLAGSVRANRRP
jgi:hypothetical protein